jgi:hypothetical protein
MQCLAYSARVRELQHRAIDSTQERKNLPMSKETARIYLELRSRSDSEGVSQGLIPPRVLGAFADIESQIEELVR